MNTQRPVVSIFMLTYNQKEFIAQAIEGVLMQKVNFSYELVIGDDGSDDGTSEICKAYQKEHPVKIKLLSSDKNVGLIHNFIRTYKQCKGTYIAICDGDDYWTDALKLQKQVDFLEKNPDFGIVFTSFQFLFPDGRLVEKDYSNQEEVTGFEDMIFGNYICSATAVFRNKQTPNDFPSWLDTCPYGDWPLYLWTTREGAKIKYLDEVTAVYRREIGVSERMKLVPSRIALENLKILNNVKQDQNFKNYNSEMDKSLKVHNMSLLACYTRESKISKMLQVSINLLRKDPIRVLRIFAYFTKNKMLNKISHGK